MLTPILTSFIDLSSFWRTIHRREHSIALVLFILACFLITPATHSQTTLRAIFTFNGDSAGDQFGFSVSGAGDVNGDGFADVIIGAPYVDSYSGSAIVFSGLDGTVLLTFYGESAGDWFGISVSGAGDVNGDGYADVIIGAAGDDHNGLIDSGSAIVFSGLDGTVLLTFYGDSAHDRFGTSVSGAGDVNDDGYADVIIGAQLDDSNGSNSGSAKVFSGLNGTPIFTFNGESAGDLFGISVSDAGDVNDDGVPDVIVGAPLADRNGIVDSGSATVFSGLDGGMLFTFYGNLDYDQFGSSVSSAGDVNGDGCADVIVGAPLVDDNGLNSGSATVFSGLDGAPLFTSYGSLAGEEFGSSVSGAGDVNGDGLADVVVGAPFVLYNGFGSATVLSGLDGTVLFTFYGDSAGDWFGHSVSGAGDGFPNVIVGANLDDSNGLESGSARVFLFSPTDPCEQIGENSTIGNESTIGDNTHIGDNVDIGDDTAIGNEVDIGDSTSIGDEVDIGDNVDIGDGATVEEDASIGEGATCAGSVGETSVIGFGASVGSNSPLGENSIIGAGSTVGNNSPIQQNSVIGAASAVGNNCSIGQNSIIGSNVTILNDVTIGENVTIGKGVTVGNGATIGDNVTIKHGVTIGNGATIPDDSIVTADVPPPSP